MFERFTTEARRVVVVAQELARAEGSQWIDPDHLALASFNDPFTITMLEDAKVATAPFVTALRRPPIGPPTSGHIPFTETTKKALEHALRRTLALKHKGITGAHILLGVVEASPEGIASRTLAQQGIGRAQLEHAATLLPVVSGSDDYAEVLQSLIASPSITPERRRELEVQLSRQHLMELRLPDARRLAERLLAEEDDSELRAVQAAVGELSGDVALALQSTTSMLAKEDLPNLHGSQAVALAHLGKPAEAEEHITKALSADGYHRYTALLEAAEIALLHGDPARAGQLIAGVDPSKFPDDELLEVWSLAVRGLAEEAAAEFATPLGRLERLADKQYEGAMAKAQQLRIAALSSRRALRHRFTRRGLKEARRTIAAAEGMGLGGVVVEAQVRLAEILAAAGHKDWADMAERARIRAAELGRILESQRAAAISAGKPGGRDGSLRT